MATHPITLDEFGDVMAGDTFVTDSGQAMDMVVGLDCGRATLTSGGVEVVKNQLEGWQYACHLTIRDLELLSRVFESKYRQRL
jgi:hypothetical protein